MTGERASLCAVAIMAKASRPGMVKTRMVPPMTYEQAAALNTCFLSDIAANIERAAGVAPIQGYAAYHPAGSEAFFETLLPPGFRLLPPREAGIGRSLLHASRDLLAAGYGSMCLVNSDSPTLPSEVLVEAQRKLAEPGDRVVLGPAIDGGYYLIGLKTFHVRLFEEIDWSTERVLRQTLERAAEIGLETHLLRPWYDVDDAAAIALLRDELSGRSGQFAGGSPAHHAAAFLRDLPRFTE
ncbi:MAG TPA: TIGR04282 family arsenosugar biosynthesis glycosyltransferase [Stellaceae bacterium]|nr:TIGR04282 family arsenosugar biosynthesis glycosyltransferase [Stellaceae bacterium]